MWWGPPGPPASHPPYCGYDSWGEGEKANDKIAPWQNSPSTSHLRQFTLMKIRFFGNNCQRHPLFSYPPPPRPKFMYSGGSSGKAATDKSPSGSGFGWSPDWLFQDQLEKFAKVPVTNREKFLRGNLEGRGERKWAQCSEQLITGERGKQGWGVLVCEAQLKSPVSCFSFCLTPIPPPFPPVAGFCLYNSSCLAGFFRWIPSFFFLFVTVWLDLLPL